MAKGDAFLGYGRVVSLFFATYLNLKVYIYFSMGVVYFKLTI